MVSGRFVVEEHEEYGSVGLRPVWMPDADPLGGMAAAHDILEHFPDDDGSIAAEFQALGAMYFLRGETGYMNHRGNTIPPEGHIGGDVVEMFRHYAHEGFDFLEPDSYSGHGLPDSVRAVFNSAVQRGFDEICSEEFPDGDAEASEVFRAFRGHRKDIAEWLRRGYRRATERYSGIDPYTLAHSVFNEIETRVGAFLDCGEEHEGQSVEILVDLENFDVSITAGWEWEEI